MTVVPWDQMYEGMKAIALEESIRAHRLEAELAALREDVAQKGKQNLNRMANYRQQIEDAEMSLAVFDEGRTSEYWERHHPEPL